MDGQAWENIVSIATRHEAWNGHSASERVGAPHPDAFKIEEGRASQMPDDTTIRVDAERIGPIKTVSVTVASGHMLSAFSMSVDEAMRLADDLTQAVRMPLADTPETIEH